MNATFTTSRSTRWMLLFLLLSFLGGGGILARPWVQQFTTAAGVGSGTFSGGSDPGVGLNPYSVAVGDVDGDGHLDVLTANLSDNTVSVRLNNGNGTFSGGSDVSVDGGPISLALGDVDGDGYLDLVTANREGTLSVRLNNGNGTFGGGSDPGMAGSPISVALGDVDGDGDLDLVTANFYDNTVSVRLNNGSGTFGGGSNFNVGFGPQSVALGDVDGDGDLDLVTANYDFRFSGSTVSVRLNNGSGTFGAGSEVIVGEDPRSVALGDVDGDGDLDLVTANYVASTVSVRLNGGNGRFGGGSNVNVGLGPYSVALGDVDGDGDLDLVTANYDANTVSVRLNGGSGTFSGSTDVGVGALPASVALGDVDGDGDLDLLTANYDANTVSVRLNEPAPTTPTPTLSSLSPSSGPAGTLVTLTGTNLTGATSVSFNGTAASFDIVSPTTVRATVPVGATTGPVTISTPGGGTSNGVGFTVPAPPVITVLSPTRNQLNAPRATSVAVSFDQAMSPGAATAGALKVFSQQRGGLMSGSQGGAATVSGSTLTFNPATDFRPGETVYTTLTTAAQNSNGVSLARPWVQQFTAAAGVGSGSFSGGSDIDLFAGGPYSVAMGDVDGDGDLDLVAANYNNKTVRVMLNNGSGAFSYGQVVGVQLSPQSVALGDVDGDGDLDLLTANVSADAANVLLNNGSGSFSGGPGLQPYVGPSPTSIVLGDMDGDGALDLLTTNTSNNTVSVRVNNGTGLFGRSWDGFGGNNPLSSDVSVGDSPYSVAVGDVDGDGDLDFVTANRGDGTVSVRLNNGNGSAAFDFGSEVSVGASPRSVALGDVDGDGDLDLLTANADANTVSVRLNNGSGVFSGGSEVSVGASPRSVAVGDVDGDGDLDLVTANFGFGANTASVRLNNGSGVFSGGSDPVVDYASRSVALGDLDGDGDLDLVTANNLQQGSSLGTLSVRLNQPAGPALSSLSPSSGVAGTSVTLTGTNFTGATGISFNGTAATTFTVTDPTTATAIVPAGTTTGNVTIITPGGISNGVAFTVLSPTTVTSIVPVGSSPTNATSVVFTVTFSQAVSGVSTDDFALVLPASGLTGSVTGVSAASGISIDVTVSSIAGNGLLGLNLNSSGTGITDAEGNAISGGFTGQTYSVDQTLPTLSLVTLGSNNASPAYAKTGDKITLNFTASEVLATLSVTIATQPATITSLGNNQYQAEYTLTATDAEGTVSFSISFSDEAGNAGTAVTATTNSSSVTFDRTAPTLPAVTIASDNTRSAYAKVGDKVTLNFTASESISTPAATIHGQTAVVSNVSGNQWMATYILQSSDAPEGVLTFSINFADPAGNAGTAVTATTNSSSVTFDKTVPTLSAVTIASNNSNTAYAKTGDVVTLNFTASENVGTLVVSIATRSVTPTNSAGNTWAASYVLTATDAEGIVPFTISFSDAAGNAGTQVSSTTNSSSVTFDRTTPALPSVIIASNNSNTALAKVGDVITLSLTASEGIPAPTVTIAAQAATVTLVSGNSYNATYTMQIGDEEGTIPFSISFRDLAGNAGTTVLSTTNSSSVTFDKTAPLVSSIDREDPTSEVTTATSLMFRVTLSEGASGVDLSDFELTATSSSSGTLSSVTSVSNSVYDVIVAVTNRGGGTLRLDLKASGTGIKDAASNDVVGGFTTGQTYTLGIPPSITGCPTTAQTFNADQGQCHAAVTRATLLSGLSFGGAPTPIVSVWVGTTEVSSSYNFLVGNTTVEVKAANGIGTDATCTFTVTVTDNQVPVIAAVSAITRNNDANACGAAITITAPAATDNCTVGTPIGTRDDGAALGAVYPLGITTITWNVKDVNNNAAVAVTQAVTVIDNQKPTISAITQNVYVLWPANHKMREVALDYTVGDNCPTGLTYAVTVTSNEPTNGTGDGDTDTDWEIVNNHLVRLRAERAAQGNGRIYTVTVTATDGAGLVTTKSINVVVSHNIVSPVSGKAVKVGSIVSFSGTFWDKPGNKHTATWTLDGNTTVKATLVEPSGLKNGTVAGAYKFTSPGVYKLQMNVKDQAGFTTSVNTAGDLEAIVVVYDPNAGYTAGGGWFYSPAGALPSNPGATGKVSYGFQSNYYKGATNPKGETQFAFKSGEFEFNALNFEYLAVSGAKAQFKGSGNIVGDRSGYSFIMTVIDGDAPGGGGVDRVRMKIFNKNTGEVIYDNQRGASDAADPITVVGAGSTIDIIGNATTTSASKRVMDHAADGAAYQLEVMAAPNPSYDRFKVNVMSDTYTQAITMHVYDLAGRIIETRTITDGSTVELGDKYERGTYVVWFFQGERRQHIKLIKLK